MGAGRHFSDRRGDLYRSEAYSRVTDEATHDAAVLTKQIAEEMNPVEFAINWGDSGVTSLLYTRGVFNFSEKITEPLPDFVANFTRKRLDDLSYLLFDMNKLESLYEEYQLSQHKNLKAIEVAIKLTSTPAKITKELFELLVLTGAVHAVVAGTAVPIVGSVIAAGAWASFALSLYRLANVTRSRGSYAYWLKDEMKKYQKLTTVIDFMENRIDKLKNMRATIDDPAKLDILNKKISQKERNVARLTEMREGQRQKMIYIAQVKKSQSGKEHGNQLVDFLNKGFSKKSTRNKLGGGRNKSKPLLVATQERLQLLSEINQHPTPQVEALVRQLRKNQRDRAISQGIDCASTGLVAVGATLVALSPLAVKAAPILLGVGMGLSLTGLSIKVGKFASVQLANFTSKTIINKKELKTMAADYEKNGSLNHAKLAGLDKVQQLRYRLSFEHSLSQLQSKFPGKSDSELETQWYRSVESMDVRKQRRLLTSAEDLAIRNNKLTRILKLGNMTPDEKKQFIATIPNQDINSIVNRYNRGRLAQSVANKLAVPTLFKQNTSKLAYDPASVKLSFRKP